MADSSEKNWEVHSVRLFPKKCGANAYKVTGIAARCDWVILSDKQKPHIDVRRNNKGNNPRHIFLSMRSPFVALEYFATKILPTLKAKFILITGSEDITIPNQIDRRQRTFNEVEREYIDRISSNPYLIHWFSENLDCASHPLMSPLPTGMVFPENRSAKDFALPKTVPFSQKTARILCAHRIRNGSQWESRRQVKQLALTDWSPWCTVVEGEISEREFIELIDRHAFVLCVEGGGLDPSPKAWQTILHHSVPIVRSTALEAAYRELPVAFVPSWDSQSISETIIQNWYEHFSQAYAEKATIDSIYRKLSLDYWWDKILSSAESTKYL